MWYHFADLNSLIESCDDGIRQSFTLIVACIDSIVMIRLENNETSFFGHCFYETKFETEDYDVTILRRIVTRCLQTAVF